MARIFLANGATNTLAAVLVGYNANGINDFVSRKLLAAITVAQCNAGGSFSNGSTISLPSNFNGAEGIISAVKGLTGLPVTTDARPLPKAAIERAEAANAKFAEATAKRKANQAKRKAVPGGPPPSRNTGKTAKNGGRAAYEARKRERSARDRELRAQMRGGQGKKK